MGVDRPPHDDRAADDRADRGGARARRRRRRTSRPRSSSATAWTARPDSRSRRTGGSSSSSAAGKIKIVKNGQLLPTPFADLPSEDTGDRGLIGIAFDPDFGVSNHYVYFYYTGHDLLNHLVRFSAAEDVGTDGPFELFRTSSPSQLLHVGGSIRFGPDGKLYFAVGDNGYGPNAQDLSNPHGKILRINKDGSIPADNPFAGQPGKLGAIWAYGFRNPWRFQFDSATGRALRRRRGRLQLGGGQPHRQGRQLRLAAERGHVHGRTAPASSTRSTPIRTPARARPSPAARSTGGSMFPAEYQGDLFFGDYAKGFIKHADLDANGDITAVHDFDDQAGSVVDLKVAPDGSLYYITYYPGALYRVSYNTDVAPCRWPTPPPTSPRASSRSRCTSRAPAAATRTATRSSYHWTSATGRRARRRTRPRRTPTRASTRRG